MKFTMPEIKRDPKLEAMLERFTQVMRNRVLYYIPHDVLMDAIRRMNADIMDEPPTGDTNEA